MAESLTQICDYLIEISTMFSDGIIGTNDDDDADDDDEEVKEGKTKIETSVRYLETKRLKV